MSRSSSGSGKSPKTSRFSPPKTVSELIDRYEQGERVFPGTHLSDEVIEYSLPGIDLTKSSLRLVFSDVDLTNACFAEADLAFCHFDANLSKANFARADLAWANFGRSNLTDANLRGTDLRHTEFKSADLSRCDFSSACLDRTALLDVSLISLCESVEITHDGPSYVDHRSIVRSLGAASLKDFLLQVGMPAVFSEYLVNCARSLDEQGAFSMLQSTFISYGAPDENFARRLSVELEANGVRTFFFPAHAAPGKKLHRLMREGVNEYDRVILICSQHSLNRTGVLNEIEETLQREARDGGASYLIPIRLDDFVFEAWSPLNADIAQSVRDRVVADFTGAETSESIFNRGLMRLLSALKKP